MISTYNASKDIYAIESVVDEPGCLLQPLFIMKLL